MFPPATTFSRSMLIPDRRARAGNPPLGSKAAVAAVVAAEALDHIDRGLGDSPLQTAQRTEPEVDDQEAAVPVQQANHLGQQVGALVRLDLVEHQRRRYQVETMILEGEPRAVERVDDPLVPQSRALARSSIAGETSTPNP